jgi:hypothetical protein
MEAHPAKGRAKKLVPDGKGQYLSLCQEHYEEFRVQGRVGPMEPFERIKDHAPHFVVKDPDKTLNHPPEHAVRMRSVAAFSGAPCSTCGRRLDEHEMPAVYVDESGKPIT